MGGRVLQWLLLDRPDLVIAAVLAASGPGQIDPHRPPTRGIPLKPALLIAERGFDAYIREQIRTTFFPADYAAEHPETLEWLVTAFIANKGSLEDYLKHVIARQQHETTALLDRMTTRTLCLSVSAIRTRAARAPTWRSRSSWHARLPNAELIVVPALRAWLLLAGAESQRTNPARLAGRDGATHRLTPLSALTGDSAFHRMRRHTKSSDRPDSPAVRPDSGAP